MDVINLQLLRLEQKLFVFLHAGCKFFSLLHSMQKVSYHPPCLDLFFQKGKITFKKVKYPIRTEQTPFGSLKFKYFEKATKICPIFHLKFDSTK